MSSEEHSKKVAKNIMSQDNKLKDYSGFQQYFINEFFDDYQEGSITRRTFVRRLAFITGSMAATNVVMKALGFDASELP